MNNIMITNGGPHKSAFWAEKTAAMIVEIGDHVAGEKRAAAVKLEAAIIDILEDHHRAVKHGERDKLAEEGSARLDTCLDCEHHLSLTEVVGEIVAAAANTAWSGDFAKPEAQDYLRTLLASHFHTSMDIERQWHGHRNSADADATAYLDKVHPGNNEGGN